MSNKYIGDICSSSTANIDEPDRTDLIVEVHDIDGNNNQPNFDKQASIEESATTSSKLNCSLCTKSYSNNSHLRRHLKRAHGCTLEDIVPKKTFQCTLCSKSYNLAHHLKRHLKVHDKSSSPNSSPVSPNDFSPPSKPSRKRISKKKNSQASSSSQIPSEYEKIRENNIAQKLKYLREIDVEKLEFMEQLGLTRMLDV